MSPNQTSNPSPTQTYNATQEKPLMLLRLGSDFGTVMWTIFIVLFCLAMLVFAWPIFPFVVGIIFMILVRHAETQRCVNSWTLAIAVEKQIPLNQTIASLAAESGLLMRGRLWRLFSYIDSGARFEDAICGVPKVIPRFALPMFRIGCLSGRPSRAMQIICSEDDSETYKLNQTLLGRLFYLLVCYLFMVFIVTFILIKIVPAFQKIFGDFGTEMIPFMQAYINLSYFVYTYWYLFVFPIVLPSLLLILFCFYVMLRSLGVVAFDFLGTQWFMRKFHRARIQESLALAAECQMPLGDALRELALFYPTFSIRRLLWRVSDRVNNGYDWKQELRKVRLLSQTEYAVAESAEASGDLPWTLRLLAEKGRRRMMYWAQWMQQILFVGLLLFFALMVLWLGFGMFGSLVKLITVLS